MDKKHLYRMGSHSGAWDDRRRNARFGGRCVGKPYRGEAKKLASSTHVCAMIERIAIQVRIEECGPGRSEIRVSIIVMGTVWSAVDAVQQTPARLTV